MRKLFILTAATLAIGAATSARADTAAMATTDLNVRSGPSSQADVFGVLREGEVANVKGCVQNDKWCTIDFEGKPGWVSANYLTSDFGGQTVILSQRPADSGVQIIERPALDGDTTAAVVAEPMVTLVKPDGTTVTAIDPPDTVRTYVRTNHQRPIYVDDEVVIGSVLPDTVQLYDVPEYQYRYVYVNGQPALVEPQSRRIVYVVR